MNVYVDASAFFKLFVREEESELVRALWEEADLVVSARVTYVEIRSALAAARRANRLTSRALEHAKRSLEERWPAVAVLDLDESLAGSAGDLAERHELRSHDAIQLASALETGDVFASWDGDLRRAAAAAGLAVAP